jgi:hypothetical protein
VSESLTDGFCLTRLCAKPIAIAERKQSRVERCDVIERRRRREIDLRLIPGCVIRAQERFFGNQQRSTKCHELTQRSLVYMKSGVYVFAQITSDPCRRDLWRRFD